jgi:tRNA/rRNA methyltransferase
MSLHHCRVVLVRTQVAGNLGATARVMRNLGFTDLVLVAPEADRNDREARRMSTHGEAILDRARILSSLSEAVADCLAVACTSARTGRLIRGQFQPPEAVAPSLLAAAAHGPVALVFGPERDGLTDGELTHSHYFLHIPTESYYPALNLAQAVAICLNCVRNAWLRRSALVSESIPAPFADQERMFDHLHAALEQIHFVYGRKGDTLMHGLRQLIGRAKPTEMELGLLHGLARQIEWYVENHPR